MSQSSPADTAPPGAFPAQRAAGSALAPRNWRVASRLILLVAIPAVLGLALTGLKITDATRSAAAYGQVSRLAMLGQQVTALTQAMEDERADTAAFIADGRPAPASWPCIGSMRSPTAGRLPRAGWLSGWAANTRPSRGPARPRSWPALLNCPACAGTRRRARLPRWP